jgi:DNA recombination protein RmuC
MTESPLFWLLFALLVALGLAAGLMLGRRPVGALRRQLEEEAQARAAERAAAAQALEAERSAHVETQLGRAAAEERAARTPDLEAGLASARAEREALAARLAALEAQAEERARAFEEERGRLIAAGEALKAEFARLSAEALKGSQEQFLQMAEAAVKRQREAAQQELEANKAALAGLLQPVSETLGRYQEGLKAIEEKREQAYGSLAQQLAAVAQGQGQVQAEAARLATALRSSGRVAGSWGESQLRNVLELAGLREGIDFTLQTVADGEAGAQRPDAIIRLPRDRQLIVDAKCSLADFLAAAGEADETARRAALARHARAVRAHAQGLAQKAYWTQFGQAADFVVMFLPGENFLAAALEQDTALLDWAFANRILLAGPINLLAIAKTVALVWRQETLAAEAREIGKLGADLHKALADMGEHVAGLGRNLGQAMGAYNAFVGSLERNVLPKARRFTELGVESGKKALPDLAPVSVEPRLPAAPELIAPPVADGSAAGSAALPPAAR